MHVDFSGTVFYCYNVRTGEFLGATNSIPVGIAPERPGLFAFLPYRVKNIEIGVGDAVVHPGDVAEITVSVNRREADVPPVRHVLNVEIVAPDGNGSPFYAGDVVTVGGRGALSYRLPESAPPGRWIITARDAATGKKGRTSIMLTDGEGISSR